MLLRTDLTAWCDEAAARGALERIPYLVVIDAEQHEAAQYANVILPIAAYTETDGTFTNHAGRVQRLREAVAPPGEAQPGWRVLGDLAAAAGGTSVDGAASAFDALAADSAGFARPQLRRDRRAGPRGRRVVGA